MVMVMFTILIAMMVSYVKTYQIVVFKYVQFTKCHLSKILKNIIILMLIFILALRIPPGI